MLLMRRDIAKQSASQPVRDALFRSIQRSEAQRFAQSLERSMFDVPVFTPEGRFSGYAPAYRVDAPRYRQHLSRIVRGLFFHETGEPLPHDVRVTPDMTFEYNHARQAEVAGYVGGGLEKVIGANTFGYTWRQTPTDPFTSIWLLMFYGVVPYLVLTVRSEAPAT